MTTLRVVDIVEGTSVDGPGLRTSIYFAGCKHFCKGCHNPQTWDFNAGKDMTIDEILHIIDRADFNVTLSGGDPIYQVESLIPLVKEIAKRGKTIWCYTGFEFEELLSRPNVQPLLEYIDTIVDGPYIEELRDTTLHFRGSSNQRIIHLKNINS